MPDKSLTSDSEPFPAAEDRAYRKSAPLPLPTEDRFKGLSDWVGPVTEEYLAGRTPHEISQKFGLAMGHIRFIICTASLRELADKHRQRIMEELLKDKIPLLREVAGLSLAGLRSFLEELITDKEKMKKLTLKDARDLSAIAKEQNETLRLELGQSTEKIELVRKVEKDVTIILEDLKKEDPFVDYSKPEDGN